MPIPAAFVLDGSATVPFAGISLAVTKAVTSDSIVSGRISAGAPNRWRGATNNVSTQAPLDVQQHPEKYRDLVVR